MQHIDPAARQGLLQLGAAEVGDQLAVAAAGVALAEGRARLGRGALQPGKVAGGQVDFLLQRARHNGERVVAAVETRLGIGQRRGDRDAGLLDQEGAGIVGQHGERQGAQGTVGHHHQGGFRAELGLDRLDQQVVEGMRRLAPGVVPAIAGRIDRIGDQPGH